MSKSRSSGQWRRQHERDEFVKRARAEGYRSRATYKLMEIVDKHGVMKAGMTVVDLGAAPGGWSQLAAQRVGKHGAVIALDLLAMEPIENVAFIQGDFREDDTLQTLMGAINSSKVDLVISDLAPNLSGVKAIDQPRSAFLVELAIELADHILQRGGNLIVKCFEGEGIAEIRANMRLRFGKVVNFKPKSSKDSSREIYVIGLGYVPQPLD